MIMLYRLEVENFFSIRDPQVLDLSVDAKVPDREGRYAQIFQGSETRAPKVIALYGANASGKTTVLRALDFITAMIRDSVRRDVPGFFGCERFNDEASCERPIRLAIELGGIMNLTPQTFSRAEAGEHGRHAANPSSACHTTGSGALASPHRRRLRRAIAALLLSRSRLWLEAVQH